MNAVTQAEVRAMQEANVAALERRIAAGELGGQEATSAAAACASIRKAWELDARYDGVVYEKGQWFAVLYVPIEVPA